MPRHRNNKLKVIKGEGKKENSWKEKILPAITLALVIFLVGLISYQWIYNWIYYKRVQIAVAEPGVLESDIKLRGIITRHEKVINAPESGLLQGGITEGERVPVNGDVVIIIPIEEKEEINIKNEEREDGFNLEDYWVEFRDMVSGFLSGDDELKWENELDDSLMETPQIRESIVVKSPGAGVVSYEVDGWEDYCYPQLPYKLLFSQSNQVNDEINERDTYISEGEPLFKIVDNWEWFFTVEIDINDGRRVANRSLVELVFSFAPHLRIKGEKIDHEVNSEDQVMYITYRITRQVPGFSRYRWADVQLYYQAYEGIIVPRSALVERENETGVLINSRGTVVFNPVVIVHYSEDEAIVEGIDEDSIIIARPGLVSEGQRLD